MSSSPEENIATTSETIWDAQREWEDEEIVYMSPTEEKRQEKPTRVMMLEVAKSLTGGDRDKSYGPPFDNLSDCAALWNAYINAKWGCIALQHDGSYAVKLNAEDVAWMMTLVKMTRSFQTGYHPDNYIDSAAYSAIAGECREILEQERGD